MVEVKSLNGPVQKLSVLNVLSQKHPDPVIPPQSALVVCPELPKIEEVECTGSHVLRVAHMIQGGAGPGGCDASHWQDTLMRYGAHSERLRESVATLVRRLANSIVPWSHIRALTACRLIAIDKCPGVRPIGVGETLRRVVGKIVCMLTRPDAEEVAGVNQLCAGTKAGMEATIHVINDLFEDHKVDGWGVLLMYARSAFNFLNQVAALWNVRVLWPRCPRYLFNTYRGWATLVVVGSTAMLHSKEGVTQGDPLSMFFYAISTFPLVTSLNKHCDLTQVWYADDASACGRVPHAVEGMTALFNGKGSFVWLFSRAIQKCLGC